MNAVRRIGFLYGLLLGFISSSVGQACPKKCVCKQRIAVHCAGVDLLNVPRRLPEGTVQLLAENNRITQLQTPMLRNGQTLHTLTLHRNQITSISSKNFRSTPSLSYLDLSQNNISLIRANAFSGLLDLRMLSLSENQISRLLPSAFNDLPSLRELFLSDNKLRAIPAALFTNFGNLQTLRLDGNSISTIPDGLFRPLTSLVHLNLGQNRIHRISTHTTIGLRSLQVLYLNDNEIEDLDSHLSEPGLSCEVVGKGDPETMRPSTEDSVLAHMKQLRVLDLRYNSLHHMHYSSFSRLARLQTLKLDGNKWRCNCDLKWKLDKIRRKLNILGREDIHCFEPRIIRNINIDDLSLSDLRSIEPTDILRTTPDPWQYDVEETVTIDHSVEDDIKGSPPCALRPSPSASVPGADPYHKSTVHGSPLDDPTFRESGNAYGTTQKLNLPTSWSRDRYIRMEPIATIASDGAGRHGDGDDDVRRQWIGEPTAVTDHYSRERPASMAPKTVRIAEMDDDIAQTRNISRIYPAKEGETDIVEEAPTILKEKGTEKWMLATVVILSLFAVVACASLSVQRYVRTHTTSPSCCLKKENFRKNSKSIRSVTTYPLLYENPLARRPLPKEPTFVPQPSRKPSEDVRWTNGGVYGLGSNRSSFISIQASQSNSNTPTHAVPSQPASHYPFYGRQSALLPPTPAQMVANYSVVSRNNHGLYSFGVNYPFTPSIDKDFQRRSCSLSPSCERQSLQRTRSAITAQSRSNNVRVPFPWNEDPARTKSDRSDGRRRPPDERRRRRKKRASRRPESAIVVPTLHELDEEFGTTLESRRESHLPPRRNHSREKIKRHRSAYRASDRKIEKHDVDERMKARDDMTRLKYEMKLDENENPEMKSFQDQDKPVSDVLKLLDGFLTENLRTSSSSKKIRNEEEARHSGREKEGMMAGANETYDMNLEEMPSIRNEDDDNQSHEERDLKPSSESSLEEYQPPECDTSVEDLRRKSRENGYDMLSLCTERTTSESDDSRRTSGGGKETGRNNIGSKTNLNSEGGNDDHRKDPFFGRKESIDSLFVDKDSICASISTLDGSSCFGDGEDDFEIFHPLLNNWNPYYGGGMYGSDQCILDSLREQDALVEVVRNQTSPGALEHYTVPLSEVSSEDEYSILQLQSVRSRSSSLGSTTTVIESKQGNNDEDVDYVYSLAEESSMPDEEKKCTSSPRDETNNTVMKLAHAHMNDKEDDKKEPEYQHIRDMYSGFANATEDVSSIRMEYSQVQHQVVQEGKERPFSFVREGKSEANADPGLDVLVGGKKNVDGKKMCQSKHLVKNTGYFETIDDDCSSADEVATDVEVLDLGTL